MHELLRLMAAAWLLHIALVGAVVTLARGYYLANTLVWRGSSYEPISDRPYSRAVAEVAIVAAIGLAVWHILTA